MILIYLFRKSDATVWTTDLNSYTVRVDETTVS
jgi:hypothetical protein